jgi:hypothetical protein
MSLRFAEGKVTHLRREFKILLDGDTVRSLESALCHELCTERPDATAITSVYFDGPQGGLFQRATQTPHDTLKIRTKEYFPDLGVCGHARVVLEAKRERNGLTRKRRVWMPRDNLSGVVRSHGGILPLITRGSIVPVLAVTYRRLVYQRSEAWRVTFDTDVAFHPVNSRLALGTEPLRRELLDAPVAHEPRVVVEVKHMGAELPEWLMRLSACQSHAYSKFATGMGMLRSSRVQVGVGG